MIGRAIRRLVAKLFPSRPTETKGWPHFTPTSDFADGLSMPEKDDKPEKPNE